MKKAEVVTNDMDIDLLSCVLKAFYDCVTRVRNNPLHSQVDTEIIVKVDKSFTSKAGNFYERAIKSVFLKSERFTVLNEAKGKNKNVIFIPKHLYTYVDNCISKIGSKEINLNSSDVIQELFQRIYEYAQKAKEQSYSLDDMISRKQDLDFALRDNILGDVYLFEIKKYGSFGADVFQEHFRKYLLSYANYVYNEDIAYEKVHINFLFVERVVDDFKFFVKSDMKGYGWISFSDFCDYFMKLSSDLRDLGKVKSPTIDDCEVARIIKRGKFVMETYPQLKSSSFKTFKNNYLKVYNA